MRAIIDEIEGLIRKIDPSMDAIPIYLLDAKEFETIDRPLDVMAWTSFLCDIQMSSQLSDLCQWRGPGFATVIYLDRLPSTLRHIGGVALHEFAHWLTFPDRPGTYGEMKSETANELVSCATRSAEETDLHSPPWIRHEPDFVRAACHLAHRAGLVSEIVPWNLCFSGPYYDVGEMVWMRTLADEIRQMERVPIRDVLQRDPPNDFRDLSRLLTGWWTDDHESNEKKETVGSES